MYEKYYLNCTLRSLSIILITMGFTLTSNYAAAENLALKKPTVPSSSAAAVDGDFKTSVGFGTGGSFYMDLGENKTVGRAVFSQVPGHQFADSMAIYASNDASTWKFVAGAKALYMFLDMEINFPSATARYFKIEYMNPPMDPGIWEYEVELYPPNSTTINLAANQKIESSVANKYSEPLTSVIDDNYKTDWIGTSMPCTLTVDLGAIKLVDRARLISDTHNHTDEFSLLGSPDKISWTTLAPANDYRTHSIAIAPIEIRYVKCIITKGTTDAGVPGPSIREFQIYGPGSATPTRIQKSKDHKVFNKVFINTHSLFDLLGKKHNFLGK